MMQEDGATYSLYTFTRATDSVLIKLYFESYDSTQQRRDYRHSMQLSQCVDPIQTSFYDMSWAFHWAHHVDHQVEVVSHFQDTGFGANIALDQECQLQIQWNSPSATDNPIFLETFNFRLEANPDHSISHYSLINDAGEAIAGFEDIKVI